MWIFRVNTVFQNYQMYPTFPMKVKLWVRGGFNQTPWTPSKSAPYLFLSGAMHTGPKNTFYYPLIYLEWLDQWQTVCRLIFVYTICPDLSVQIFGCIWYYDISMDVHVRLSAHPSACTPVCNLYQCHVIFSLYISMKFLYVHRCAVVSIWGC